MWHAKVRCDTELGTISVDYIVQMGRIPPSIPWSSTWEILHIHGSLKCDTDRLAGVRFPSPKSKCSPSTFSLHSYPYPASLYSLLRYQDVRSANVAVNHVAVADLRYMNDSTLRPALWRDVAYHTMPYLTLISRSCSLQASPRLSADFRNGCHGWMFFISPYDTTQGEIDYDSFAFVVACLGIYLCEYHQVCRFQP